VCGVVGVWRPSGVDEAELRAMNDRLAHRGPDDAGIQLVDARVGFGHRRLSIVDLSAAGHQPMCNEDGTVWVTYNGEVYNQASLRPQLERAGHTFRSHSDTEVIVHAYEEWGDECVRRLDGMFAFAIWDGRRRRLLLARDRLGIKPLYWYAADGVFAFASELKALAGMTGARLPLDETALYDFLTYLYVPTPKTPYTTVRKLPPAHTMVVTDAGPDEPRSYWDVDFSTITVRREVDAIEGVRSHLTRAVDAHMMSDVPLGSLLSGGVDSSAVTLLATRFTPKQLKTFSIGFDVEAHSEVTWARLAADRGHTDHHERTVALASARDALATIDGLYDEPFADGSAIPTRAVCVLARETVKVVLSGDGGDEVFGGYGWYTRQLRRARFPHVPSIVRRHLPVLLERSRLMKLRGVPTLVDGLRDPIERHVVAMGGFTRAQKERILSPAAWRRYRDYDDYWVFRRHWRDDLPLMSRLQYLDLKTYLPDDILTKVDRASMSVALEVRPPLLDHHLVEYVASIDPEIRTPGGRLKHIFKRAVEGIVPEEILGRAKKGFSIPLASWIDGLATTDRDGAPHHRFTTTLLRSWLASTAQRSSLLSA
jgi:asparagine synthase (glutamine-hydrolysing)